MQKQVLSKEHKKIKRKAVFQENLPSYIMLAPFFVFFFIFLVLPILSSIVLSFTTYDMINKPSFAGLGNYIRMFFDDDVFPVVFKNTMLFAIICGPAGFLLSFVLAWFINEFSPIARTLLSFMFYVPALVGNATFIWQVAFSSDSYGYVNSALLSLGLITEPVTWLSTEQYIKPIVIAVQLWSSMGVSFLSNISGLQNVNKELYEAGAIDGIRNRWQELWYITVPQMAPQMMFAAVMTISSSFAVGYQCMELTGFPSTDYSTHTILLHILDVGTIRFDMGYASALAVILFGTMVLMWKIISSALSRVSGD